LVLKQALGKTGKSPVFPLNLRKLFQKLKFWKSLSYLETSVSEQILLKNAVLQG
jgi:hypothetical protein